VVLWFCARINPLVLCPKKCNIAKKHFPGLNECKHIKLFQGQNLPDDLSEDGMYVPMNTNFPNIDMIWKMGQNIWFVQAHVAEHEDVKVDLEKMLDVI